MFKPTQQGGTDSSDAIHGGVLLLQDAAPRPSEFPPPSPPPDPDPALHLFLHAAFTAREPALLAEGDRDTAALFGIGAVAQAAALSRISDRQARRTTRALLRWSFGVGRVRAWQWERLLRKRALTTQGRRARHEGCASLLAWLQGEDPARRLSRLLDRPACASSLPRAALHRATVQPLPVRHH